MLALSQLLHFMPNKTPIEIFFYLARGPRSKSRALGLVRVGGNTGPFTAGRGLTQYYVEGGQADGNYQHYKSTLNPLQDIPTFVLTLTQRLYVQGHSP